MAVQARDYTQGELPSDIFNSSSGDIKQWGNELVEVRVNSNGTRYVRPLSYEEQARRTADQQRSQYMEAIKPAVQSLEAGIPETSAAFAERRRATEAEVDPLKERYANLIDQIKGREQKETTQTIRSTAREYGRRGIPLSSTAYAEEEQGRTQPISQYYTGQLKDTEIARESDLRQIQNLLGELTIGETSAQREIRQAIANLQAGAGTNAIQSANEITQAALNRVLQQAGLDLQQRQLESSIANANADRDLALRKFNEYELPYLNYVINKPYYKESSGSSGTGYNDPLGLGF
jgi:hypothetical protein